MNRLTKLFSTKRRVLGLLGAGLLLGSLAACSHAPSRMGEGGMEGMTSMGMGRGHRGPMSEEDMARMRERFMDRATRELSLDDAQKARLGALADAMKAQHKALAPAGQMGAMGAGPGASGPQGGRMGGRGDMAGPMGGRGEMAALIAGDKFDRTKAQALIDAKTNAVRTQAPAVMTAAADFFDSLKPEQQAKVRQFLSQRRGHRHGAGDQDGDHNHG